MHTVSSDVGLVIFDCDGVLVDSEPLAVRILQQTLNRLGLEIDRETAYARFLGRSLASVLDELETEDGLVLGPDDLEHMRRDLAALFRAELQPIRHVGDAIRDLSRQYAVCVASSSVPERLNLALTVTGLMDLFEGRIYSATQVENGKPAPDLFLHAAQQFGIAPENCLVIEDSTAGVRAARAAGMRVFGFFGGAHARDAGLSERLADENPDRLFDDMRDLPRLIAETKAGTASAGAKDAPENLIAVDVGTASVRAGIIAPDGTLLGRADHPIVMWRQGARIGEYASAEIWQAVCTTVRAAVASSGVSARSIAGIGFDATCSLVFLDAEGKPLPVSIEPGAERDTIAWFDHRAINEALEISGSGHEVLGFSGGALSPEMEIPKLMWLKRHRPEIWARIGAVFDLADYLTWRASGANARSQSTLTSKWSFLAHEPKGWREDFFALAGLDDLKDKARLPENATAIGQRAGTLTRQAAAELGLEASVVVATGMVDAHAGALGVLGSFLDKPDRLTHELALIAGTSSCVAALAPDPKQVEGLWGPYLGAAAPDLWLSEGGQSASGALLDHVIAGHSAGGEPDAATHAAIVARIAELRSDPAKIFAKNLHVVPDFHGNRSPFHDPVPRGIIAGLDLEPGFDGLCALYWRTAVGLAMGLRQILELMADNGFDGKALHIAGGHAANDLLMQLYADATGLDIVTYPTTAPLLNGMAMGVAVAAGVMPDLATAGLMMRTPGRTIRPRPEHTTLHDADYAAYLMLQKVMRG